MFRTREYKALPINWREIYKVDKMKDVPEYAWNNRGTLIDWYDVIPCMFSNREEEEEFDKEHHKYGLVRQKFADWWMSSEPEIIEVDPETIKEVKREYIICAAIWYKDGTEAPRGFIAQNIDSGVVIGQYRHGNCINVRATNPIWNKKKLTERLSQSDDKLDSWENIDYEKVDGFLTSEGRFVDRWQAMELAYMAGQVDYERAKNKKYTGEYVDTAVFQAQVPHERHTNNDGNGWNMMYSEDIY